MDDQTPALTQQAQAGVARVPWQRVLNAAAGASTMGILLAAGLAPFVTALGAGTLASAPVAQWLVGLGGNVIAGWFGEAALALTKEGIAHQTNPAEVVDPALIAALAQRLDALAATNPTVREEMDQIVNGIGAIPLMVAALQRIQEEQGAQSEVLLEVYRRLETLYTEVHNELPSLRPAIESVITELRALRDNNNAAITRLEAEIAELNQALGQVAAIPAAYASVQATLHAKQQELAALRGGVVGTVHVNAPTTGVVVGVNQGTITTHGEPHTNEG